MNGTVGRRLEELGFTLPPPQGPAANYLPFARHGGLVQLAGVIPFENGRCALVGKVGRDVSLEDARRGPRLCALTLLANLQLACYGDLDRVRPFLMVRGFVNADDALEDTPAVIDGASDLIVAVFGAQVGEHARTAIGCATLPRRAAVEIDALIAIDAND